jgi:transposase
LHFVKKASEGYRRLKRASGVRRNLIKAKVLIANQLENAMDADIRASIVRLVDSLDRQIEKMDDVCSAAIASDENMNALAKRLEQVVGIGPVLINTTLATCPDIGSFTAKGIAKFAGVAPLDNKSCTIKKKPKPRRGRRDLRSALYMAAVSACHSNHRLQPMYKGLLARGVPKRVALIALARHIIVLMNYIAKYPDFNPAIDPKKAAMLALPRRGSGRPRKNP